MRFCSECGARLPAAPPVECGSCGARHWRNAKPGAGVLVVDGGKLLLVRRALDPWRGSWCAPAGFCDGAEHPIETAEREAFEEAGLRVRVTGFLGIWTGGYGDGDGAATPETISVAWYHAVPAEGEVGAPDPAETAEVRWFAPDAVPADLAPPDRFPEILDAWRAAIASGRTVTPLPDRPG